MTELRLIRGARSTWSVEGGAGRLHVSAARGGTAVLAVAGGPDVTVSSEVLLEDGERLVQGQDRDATVVPLLQAGEVAGLRCQYALTAADGRFVGDGFAEYWFADEVRVATGIRIEDDPVARAVVQLEVDHDTPVRVESTAAVFGTPAAATAVDGATEIDPTRSSALDWVRTCPPFYARWMDFIDQWSLDPAAHGFADVEGPDAVGDRTVASLAYRAVDPGTRGLVAAGVLTVRPASSTRAGAVEFGAAHHFAPSTGIHHVTCSADGGTVTVTPPSTDLVIVGIDGFRSGAVTVDVGDADASITLLSGSGGIDDPVVPLRRPHDRPADRVLVAARPRTRTPLEIDVACADGVHAAVQYRDERRRLTLHHPDDARPVATVETATGRLLDLRLPGHDVALADLPLHWLRYLGKSSTHVTDDVEAVEVASWGPDAVDLTLRSRAAGGRTSSTVRLVLPYLDDRIVVHLTATLRGAAAWRASTAEFADLFPEVGIDPANWRYRHVALLRAAGDTVVDMHDPYPGLDRRITPPIHVLDAFHALRATDASYGPWPLASGDGVLLHGSEAADVVVTIGQVRPAGLEQVATYCEHWGDVHLDVVHEGTMPTPTEVASTDAALPDEITVDYTLTLLPASGPDVGEAMRRARREILDRSDG